MSKHKDKTKDATEPPAPIKQWKVQWNGEDHLQLTEDEQTAMNASATLANACRRVIGNGPQAEGDWAEMARSIHDIQARILSQVAAWAGLSRPLGGRVNDD